MTREYSAGCYLVKKEGDSYKLCVIHRHYDDMPNAYVLPKGHIDPGESKEMAAKRETAEEAGYRDITILGPVGNDIYPLESGHEKIVYWFGAILNNPDEVAQLNLTAKEKNYFIKTIWVDLDEAKELLTFVKEENKKRIEKVKEFLKLHSLN